ncbi:MAG: hypothetical protein ACRES5_17280, partial [Pseudomonas sp.]
MTPNGSGNILAGVINAVKVGPDLALGSQMGEVSHFRLVDLEAPRAASVQTPVGRFPYLRPPQILALCWVLPDKGAVPFGLSKFAAAANFGSLLGAAGQGSCA